MYGHPGCRLYLIRHGETANSDRNCFNGHFDVDLSPKGVSQMRQVANALALKHLSAIYSSDLQRARKGAQIIGLSQGLEPQVFTELRELSVGKWEGLSKEKINQQYPKEIEHWYDNIATARVEGGETLQELHNRVIPKMDELVAKHTSSSIAVVCHGGVNRIVLSHILGIPWDRIHRIKQDFIAVNTIQFYSGTVVVERINGSPLEID